MSISLVQTDLPYGNTTLRKKRKSLETVEKRTLASKMRGKEKSVVRTLEAKEMLELKKHQVFEILLFSLVDKCLHIIKLGSVKFAQ